MSTVFRPEYRPRFIGATYFKNKSVQHQFLNVQEQHYRYKVDN